MAPLQDSAPHEPDPRSANRYLDIVGLGALNIDYIATRTNLAAGDPQLVAELKQRFEHGTERPVKAAEIEGILSKVGLLHFDTYLGGSAFNVIQALAAMDAGLRLGYIGVAGRASNAPILPTNDFMAWFRHHRVDSQFVEASSERPGSCISYINDGERSLLTYPGANLRIGAHLAQHREELIDFLSRCRILHVTSLFDDDSPEILADLLAEAKRRNPWLVLAFDPGHHWTVVRPRGFETLLAIADYIFVNNREFQQLGQHRIGDTDEDLARRILKSSDSHTLAIVLKRYDSITVLGRLENRRIVLRYGNVALEPEEIEDATGAGDVFAAGFLASRLFSWMEIRHGIELGLHLVHEKLRAGGTTSFPSFARIFTHVVDSIVLEHRDGPTAPVVVPAGAPGRAAAPAAEPAPSAFAYSSDYRSVRRGHETFEFTATQAAIVGELHHAWQQGTPGLSQARLLDSVGSKATRLYDLFRNSAAWGTLIVPGRKGTYRLALPPHAT